MCAGGQEISFFFLKTASLHLCCCPLSFFCCAVFDCARCSFLFFWNSARSLDFVGKISKEIAEAAQQKKRELLKIHAYFWYLSIAVRENNCENEWGDEWEWFDNFVKMKRVKEKIVWRRWGKFPILSELYEIFFATDFNRHRLWIASEWSRKLIAQFIPWKLSVWFIAFAFYECFIACFIAYEHQKLAPNNLACSTWLGSFTIHFFFFA